MIDPKTLVIPELINGIIYLSFEQWILLIMEQGCLYQEKPHQSTLFLCLMIQSVD